MLATIEVMVVCALLVGALVDLWKSCARRQRVRRGLRERARELLVDVIDLQQEIEQLANTCTDTEIATSWQRASDALNKVSEALLREIEASEPEPIWKFWRSDMQGEIRLNGRIVTSLKEAKIAAIEANYEWLACALERAIFATKALKNGNDRSGMQTLDGRVRQLLKGMSAASRIAQVELTLKLDAYNLMFSTAAALLVKDENIFAQTWERIFARIERAKKVYCLVVSALESDDFERIPTLVGEFDNETQAVRSQMARIDETVRCRDDFVRQIKVAQVSVEKTLTAVKQQYEYVGIGQKPRRRVPDTGKAFMALCAECEQRLAQTYNSLAMAQTMLRLGDILMGWAYFDKTRHSIKQLTLFSQELLRLVNSFDLLV